VFRKARESPPQELERDFKSNLMRHFWRLLLCRLRVGLSKVMAILNLESGYFLTPRTLRSRQCGSLCCANSEPDESGRCRY
jgi:hypothetical protein